MRNVKKMIAVGTMVLAIGGMSVTSFAVSTNQTPAEVLAGITGRTVESVIAERSDLGKTYGAIASQAGKLTEFKTGVLETKKENLAEQVATGKITQEKADAIMKALEENQATCDGTGSAKIGRSMGARFGSNGTGEGNMGANCGNGANRGQNGGRGMGLQNGSCYVTTE